MRILVLQHKRIPHLGCTPRWPNVITSTGASQSSASTIGIIHKNIIESQICYAIVLFAEYVGVRLEHQHGNVKIESTRHPSDSLQPRE